MELRWKDSDGKQRCTVLHSKLATRNFPKVNQVLDECVPASHPLHILLLHTSALSICEHADAGCLFENLAGLLRF